MLEVIFARAPAYETAVATFSRVRDEELIRETQTVLEKANEAAEKVIGG
ncbi:MAG: hypothetical protein NWE85_00765 [Candidatus Bathyarchaeota archaeon]|nr:hypothetical protein [Candidatus Bathyarchaeota archaeon]